MQPSTESLERINLLLSLGRFNENTQDALRKHFVQGFDIEMCCYLCDLRQSNLVRSITRLNEINHVVEQIKELEIYHLTERKGSWVDLIYDEDMQQ